MFHGLSGQLIPLGRRLIAQYPDKLGRLAEMSASSPISSSPSSSENLDPQGGRPAGGRKGGGGWHKGHTMGGGGYVALHVRSACPFWLQLCNKIKFTK